MKNKKDDGNKSQKRKRGKNKDEIAGEEHRRQNRGGRRIARKKESWKGKSGIFKKWLNLEYLKND